MTDHDKTPDTASEKSNRFLFAKKGDLIAHVVAIGFSSTGGMKGIALWVYDQNHHLLHSRLQPLQDAIKEGNAFVDTKGNEDRKALMSTGEDETETQAEAEIPPDDVEDRSIIKEYEKANIKTQVTKMAGGTGHWVRINVDGKYITSICKDRNTAKVFDLATAMKRAASLVKWMQGWSTDPW